MSYPIVMTQHDIIAGASSQLHPGMKRGEGRQGKLPGGSWRKLSLQLRWDPGGQLPRKLRSNVCSAFCKIAKSGPSPWLGRWGIRSSTKFSIASYLR